MALKFLNALRDARNNAIETTVGTSPKLRVYSGAQPAAITDAASGTLLAELTLPSDWLGASASGVVSKAGTWTGTATGAGDAGYFRITNSAGSTAYIQGTVTETGGGGDAIIDNANIDIGQVVTVNTFAVTDGNPPS